ncbi:hypothetical protein AB0O28_18675 [Microbispora sp. NPDC088329]|uniref:hypothetical protein n=1 Tax=Microbispora sp. NPDC088329 TaxID=3154869 RepID=UPI0034343BD5
MTIEIASLREGRNAPAYHLADEIADAHGMSRSEAHAAIHAMLGQIAEIDGDGVILARRPQRPELLKDNPHDLDIDWWLTISEDTADQIREAIAAQQPPTAD